MNKNTNILHKILLCLVLVSSFFSFTACPQFDRSVDPDYKLFKDKPVKNKNGNNNDKGSDPVTTVAFSFNAACMASNERLYMSGSKSEEPDLGMLYSMEKDDTSLTEEHRFSSQIKFLKEIDEGTLLVVTAKEIYRYDIETSQLSETVFASFANDIRDVIPFNAGYAVITDAPNISTYWYLLSESGDKLEVRFPTIESKMSTVVPGTDYCQLSGENVIVYLSDVQSNSVNASKNIYGVRFVLTDASTPKAYVSDSQYYNNEYSMKAPLAVIGDTRIITANGHVFDIDVSKVKQDNTDFTSKWCCYNKDYMLEYSQLYIRDNYIYFSKNDSDGDCIVERRPNTQAEYSCTTITYEGEKSIGFFEVDRKFYFITSTISNNNVNFNMPENDFKNLSLN